MDSRMGNTQYDYKLTKVSSTRHREGVDTQRGVLKTKPYRQKGHQSDPLTSLQ